MKPADTDEPSCTTCPGATDNVSMPCACSTAQILTVPLLERLIDLDVLPVGHPIEHGLHAHRRRR